MVITLHKRGLLFSHLFSKVFLAPSHKDVVCSSTLEPKFKIYLFDNQILKCVDFMI